MLSLQQEIMWLAGLLEGEGCFMTARSRGREFPRLQVGMCDRDVIDHVARLFGTSVYAYVSKKDNIKPVFYAQIHGLKAVWVMRQALPFMGQRRAAKIQELIDGHKLTYNKKLKPWSINDRGDQFGVEPEW